MGTKRLTALLLAAALAALALTGCAAQKKTEQEDDGAMTISPAQLSGEETALLELMNVGLDAQRIFDFQVEGAKSAWLRAYELVGNDWNCVVQGAVEAVDGTGRVALTFGKMAEGVRMAYSDGSGIYSREFTMEAGDISGIAFATSALTGPVPIELDREIPLVLQIGTSQGEFSTYSVDYFAMPRELAKHGYEHVYAITVTFSGSDMSASPPDGGASAPAEPTPAE